MTAVRVLIELDNTNPIFYYVPNEDISAEAIYMDWLRPLIAVWMNGAKIVDIEKDGPDGTRTLFGGAVGLTDNERDILGKFIYLAEHCKAWEQLKSLAFPDWEELRQVNSDLKEDLASIIPADFQVARNAVYSKGDPSRWKYPYSDNKTMGPST